MFSQSTPAVSKFTQTPTEVSKWLRITPSSGLNDQNRIIEKFKMPFSAVVLGYWYKSFGLCDALSVPVPPVLV